MRTTSLAVRMVAVVVEKSQTSVSWRTGSVCSRICEEKLEIARSKLERVKSNTSAVKFFLSLMPDQAMPKLFCILRDVVG